MSSKEAEENMEQALDIRHLVKRLASIEGEGVAFYQSLAKHSRNEKIKKLALTMVKVEQSHQRRFEELERNMGNVEDAANEITAEVREYIHTLIDHRIFHTPEHAAKLAASITDENEAIDMAINFEKENILLLFECGAILSGEARDMVKTFITQEKQHVISLKRIREQLAKM
jgi:rubrerythrin